MKDVLRAIDRGETVTVLYRGKEKAILTPIEAVLDPRSRNAPKMEDQPFFGMWKDREDLADPDAYVRSLRQPRSFFPEPGPKRRDKLKHPK